MTARKTWLNIGWISVFTLLSVTVLVLLVFLAKGYGWTGPDYPPKRAWDGSHKGLTKAIKSAMHDPSSYEHVKTVYDKQGDYYIVKTTFRGRNGFGAVMLSSITAKVDSDGDITAIIGR